MLLGGGVLVAAFIAQEATTRRPWVNLRFAASGNFPLLFLLNAFFRFVLLSTSYIIPLYLTTVQNYRAIEVGSVLIWIALPQFLMAPVVATALRFVDARLTIALGFAFVGAACFMGGQLTQAWVGEDFLPSQIVQAMGQSLGVTSLIWFFLRHLDPREMLTFGAVLQTGRLFGGIGRGVRPDLRAGARADAYSNVVGLHVTAGSFATDQRLRDYARAVTARSIGQGEARARATALLARSVQTQANVLAYIDGFMVIGFAVIGVLLMMLLLRNPPTLSGTSERARGAAT